MSYFNCCFLLPLLTTLTACTIDKDLLTGEDSGAADSSGTVGASSDGATGTGVSTGDDPGATTMPAATDDSNTSLVSTTGGDPSATDGGATDGDPSATDNGSVTNVSEVTGAMNTEGSDTTNASGDTTDGGGDRPQGAAVGRTCAPNDGPAVEFRLLRASNECSAEPDDPNFDLRVVLYQAAPLAPGSYVIDPNSGHWTLVDDGQFESGQTGTLEITAWDANQVSGEFELDFGGGVLFPGSFELAPFCGNTPQCG